MSSFLGISGSISSSFAPLIDNQNILWVGKHGSDSNDGKTIEKAFLTFGAALSASSAGIVVVCLDSGIYNESIIVPENRSVYAPSATIQDSGGGYYNGVVEFTGDNSSVTFHSIISAQKTAVYKALTGNGGTNWLYADKIVQTGTVGVGVFNFDTGAVVAPAVILANVNSIFTERVGVGCDVIAGGHMHVKVGDLYLQANNAVGVGNYGTSSVVGRVDHIVQLGTLTGLIGVWHGAGGAGFINLNISTIDVGASNTAYNGSNGTINMFLNYLASGNIGASGATINVTTP